MQNLIGTFLISPIFSFSMFWPSPVIDICSSSFWTRKANMFCLIIFVHLFLVWCFLFIEPYYNRFSCKLEIEKVLLKRRKTFLKCLPVLPCHVCLQLMLSVLILTWLESRRVCPFLYSVLSKTLTLCMTKFFLVIAMWLAVLFNRVSCVCSDCFLHEDYEMSYNWNGYRNSVRQCGAWLAFVWWVCQFCDI